MFGYIRPEQVKRWAILTDSPAIDSGELTGNPKLRRQVVLARRAEVVQMLYCRVGRGGPGGSFGGSLGEAPGGNPGAAELGVPGVLHGGESRCA